MGAEGALRCPLHPHSLSDECSSAREEHDPTPSAGRTVPDLDNHAQDGGQEVHRGVLRIQQPLAGIQHSVGPAGQGDLIHRHQPLPQGHQRPELCPHVRLAAPRLRPQQRQRPIEQQAL